MDEIILKYLNETATKEEMKLLLEWLNQSDESQKYFFEIRDLWLASNAAYPHKREDNKAFIRFKERVMAHEKARSQRRLPVRWLKVAASVAILVLCSVGGYYIGDRASQMPQTIVMNQCFSGESDKTMFSLPDGTSVWLNSSSRLVYPEKFETGSRRVQLDGEGYFEVAHNAESPFYVEVNGLTVKVLGTHFDIKSYDQKEISEVILLSGKVEVDLAGSEKVMLAPNQKLSMNKMGGTYQVESVDATEYIVWKNKKMVFDQEELGTILRKMEHWYDIKISYKEDIPLKSQYSLIIRDESKEEILEMLSIIAPISYTVQGDQVVIQRKEGSPKKLI